jgi:hypothetical protein
MIILCCSQSMTAQFSCMPGSLIHILAQDTNIVYFYFFNAKCYIIPKDDRDLYCQDQFWVKMYIQHQIQQAHYVWFINGNFSGSDNIALNN